MTEKKGIQQEAVLLRRALRGNAAFSATSGLMMLLFAAQLAGWLGNLASGQVRFLGLILVLFAGHLLLTAGRRTPRGSEVWAAVLSDVGWVVGAAALLLAAPDILSAGGRLALAVVSVPVGVFAVLQYLGWRRLVGTGSLGAGPVAGALVLLALLMPGAATADSSASERSLDFIAWEVGEWDSEIIMPGGPDGTPMTFAGHQVDRMSGCGNWLITDLSLVDDGSGAVPPYEGHGVLGFDPVKGKLVGIWVDSQQQWLGIAEGEVSGDGKTLTLEVSGRHPADGSPLTTKFVTRRLSDDRRELTVLAPAPDGGEVVAARIVSSRR